MHLDQFTEVVSSMASLFVMAMGMLLLWSRDKSPSLRDWTFGISCAATGNVVSGFFSQTNLPILHSLRVDDWAIAGGFTAITAGYILILRGLHKHFQLPWPRAYWLLVYGSIVLYLAFMWPTRSVVAWSLITLWSRAILCIIGFNLLIRQRHRLSARAAVMTFGPLLIQGPYVFIRGFWLLLPPDFPLQNVFTSPVTYLVATLATLGLMLGLLILHFESLLDQLQEAANTDALTGLHNRRSFTLLAGHEIDKALRTRAPLWLLLIDIDHFKSINDQYGHAVGDWVLQEISLLFKNVVRKSDIVARYGGEEFCVVLPETDEHQAHALTQRLFESIALLKRSREPDSGAITVSIGAAGLRAEDANVDGLVKRADVALYQAKNAGRNRIVGLGDAPTIISACDEMGIKSN